MADQKSSLVGRNEHGAYCVPHASRQRPAARAILGSDVWEADTIELLRRVDSANDIIHAGAFFGDFIPALARSRAAGALVWAFEPSSENHRCAQETIQLNGLSNVVLTNAALDASPGAAFLATTTEDGVPLGGGSHILDGRDLNRPGAREAVELATVDEVVGEDRHVGAIQLDVEGRESQALAGAIDTIERCRPLLVLEKSHRTARWVADNLEPLGYEMKGSVHQNFVVTCR